MSTNAQAPEKRITDDGHKLDVNSIFHTIQGEGPFAGTPAVFIRLAGCNLQCPQCDTEYTERNARTIGELLTIVQQRRRTAKLVVITGGEPFRQEIGPLVRALLIDGYRVQIETNGTFYRDLPFEHARLFIVCSPKTGAVNSKLLPHICAFKYVANVESLVESVDGLPTYALGLPARRGLYRPPIWCGAEVYLQPVDEKDAIRNAHNLHAVVRNCLHFGYRLCLQTHKLINVP